MSQVGTIASVWRYPAKSMQGDVFDSLRQREGHRLRTQPSGDDHLSRRELRGTSDRDRGFEVVEVPAVPYRDPNNYVRYSGRLAEAIADLEAALERAGVDHEVITYPGAPHSFFDRRQTDFAEESADAWRRVLDFIAAHS